MPGLGSINTSHAHDAYMYNRVHALTHKIKIIFKKICGHLGQTHIQLPTGTLDESNSYKAACILDACVFIGLDNCILVLLCYL